MVDISQKRLQEAGSRRGQDKQQFSTQSKEVRRNKKEGDTAAILHKECNKIKGTCTDETE